MFIYLLISETITNSLCLNLFLWIQVGPKGLEFARYSLDYHTIRNYLHVVRKWGKERFVQVHICSSVREYTHVFLSHYFFFLVKLQSWQTYATICKENCQHVQPEWRNWSNAFQKVNNLIVSHGVCNSSIGGKSSPARW